MRQRRRWRQNRGEGVQLFPGGSDAAATGHGVGLAVDRVVKVDRVQRLVDEPPVDGHTDLLKNISRTLICLGQYSKQRISDSRGYKFVQPSKLDDASNCFPNSFSRFDH